MPYQYSEIAGTLRNLGQVSVAAVPNSEDVVRNRMSDKRLGACEEGVIRGLRRACSQQDRRPCRGGVHQGKRVSGPPVDIKSNSRKTSRVPQSGDATSSPFGANARRGIKRMKRS